MKAQEEMVGQQILSLNNLASTMEKYFEKDVIISDSLVSTASYYLCQIDRKFLYDTDGAAGGYPAVRGWPYLSSKSQRCVQHKIFEIDGRDCKLVGDHGSSSCYWWCCCSSCCWWCCKMDITLAQECEQQHRVALVYNLIREETPPTQQPIVKGDRVDVINGKYSGKSGQVDHVTQKMYRLQMDGCKGNDNKRNEVFSAGSIDSVLLFFLKRKISIQ